MMRTLCFGFLVLTSSQMIIGAEVEPKFKFIDGALFSSWHDHTKKTLPLILDSAPIKQCVCVASGLSAGITLAMNGCTLSPLFSLSLISLIVGRQMIVERHADLCNAFSTFTGDTKNNAGMLAFDSHRVVNKAWLQSLIIPTLVGLTGVVLYGFASRYQFKMLPR
jgi:hypothetical protein